MLPYERIHSIIDTFYDFYQIAYTYDGWHYQIRLVKEEGVIKCLFAKPTTIKPEIEIKFELPFEGFLTMSEQGFQNYIDSNLRHS